MTISNNSSITGPIPGWAVGGVGLTSTNYRTCITLIYCIYKLYVKWTSFQIALIKLSEWAKIKGAVTYRK